MTPRSIIIDADPGNDDAVALLLALASPELAILGVTTVAGNVPLALTTRNARALVEQAGRSDVAVHAGADKPLVRAPVSAEHVHGQSGLGGVVLAEPTLPLADEKAVDFIIRTLNERPAGSVTLCALGPLTNLAQALMQAPKIATRLREVVLMGGSGFVGGNVTPCAEFNVYADPHAAQVVFRSGAPIVMLPLDVTHQVISTRERIAAIGEIGNRAGQTVAQLLSFAATTGVENYDGDGAPLHDPCVIAYLLRPELFGGRHINVEIETGSALTMGTSVVDWWGVSGRPANATFLRTVDAPGFYALLGERLAQLP